jgi:phosphatidylglycerophosphatase A
MNRKLVLFVAQGFGVGRIPFAPGTFGSVLGFGWFAVLLLSGRLWVVFAASALAAVLAVWLCGAAERILGQKDPGSVVLDEIVAIPFCFGSWVALSVWHGGALPTAVELFSQSNWPLVFFVFAAFRFFDILKPWPVRQSQALPGGWGVVVDDLLAGVYVALGVLVYRLAWH